MLSFTAYFKPILKAILDVFAKWFTPLAPPFSIISMSKDPSAKSMKSQMHQKTLKQARKGFQPKCDVGNWKIHM